MLAILLLVHTRVQGERVLKHRACASRLAEEVLALSPADAHRDLELGLPRDQLVASGHASQSLQLFLLLLADGWEVVLDDLVLPVVYRSVSFLLSLRVIHILYVHSRVVAEVAHREVLEALSEWLVGVLPHVHTRHFLPMARAAKAPFGILDHVHARCVSVQEFLDDFVLAFGLRGDGPPKLVFHR